MASRLPNWLVASVRNRTLTSDAAEELRAAMRAGDVPTAVMRLVLLQPLNGPLAVDIRRELLDWLTNRAHMAPNVVLEYVQAARLAKPTVRERSGQAQVVLRLNDGQSRVGDWARGANPKERSNRAYLNLLRELTANATSSAAVKALPSPAGGLRKFNADNVDRRADQRTRSPQVPPVALSQDPDADAAPRVSADSAVFQLLDRGWELAFDADVCPSRAQMLCVPPRGASYRDDGRSATGGRSSVRVARTIRYGSEDLHVVECVPVEILATAKYLVRNGENSAWSTSRQAWSAIARVGMRWIAAHYILPTVLDARDPADRAAGWRLGPVTASNALDAAISSLGEAPQCVATWDGRIELPPPPNVVREFLDAMISRFVLAPPFQWCLGDKPFVSGKASAESIAAVQDWADDVEFDADGPVGCRVVLRVFEPDAGDEQSVLAELLIGPPSPGSPLVPAAAVWRGEAPAPIDDPRLRLRLRCLLRRAGRQFRPLYALGQQHRPETVLASLHSAALLRGTDGEMLREYGIEIDWHNEWVTELEPRVLIGVEPPGLVPDGTLGLAQILDRRWQLSLAGVPLSAADLKALVAAAMPLVRMRNRWVLIDEPTRTKIERPALDPVPRALGVVDALLGTVVLDGRVVACSPTDGLAHLLRAYRASEVADSAERDDLPKVLLAHQRVAVQWLNRISQLGLNGLLADEMGLGKTMIGTTFHASSRRPYQHLPTLVLCPSGKIAIQWRDNAAKHLPEVNVVVHWGPRRRLPAVLGTTMVVTTYDTLAMDLETIGARTWGLLIADEAQTIKNPATRAARNVRSIDAHVRVAMTGTPLENHPRELWAILDWINPDLFGSSASFNARYVAPLPFQSSEGRTVLRERIHAMMAPVVLRRTKQDPTIAAALTKRSEHTHVVALSNKQVSLLEGYAHDTDMQYRASRSTRRSGEAILKVIDAQIKICNSPQLLEPVPLEAILATVLADPAAAAQNAPKLARLHDLLGHAMARGESTLVFTPYAKVARFIDAYLRGVGIATALHHGALSSVQKRQALEAIEGGSASALVLTVGSGGVGLNLHRPNHVIHYNRPWNPALEDQASDRVHRYGQRRDVHVHYLMHANSIEEHIAAKHRAKRKYPDIFLPTGSTDTDKFTPSTLAALYQLEMQ